MSSGAEILHLYRSQGHNYIGHHGREPDSHPLESLTELHCVAGRGIEGDRFFDHKENFKGQITFFDHGVYLALLAERPDVRCEPSAFRRNVIISGLPLNDLVGHRFEVQGLQFEGTEQCRPCYWMDRAVAAGTENFLQGRGGLRARILTSGNLAVGPAAWALLD